MTYYHFLGFIVFLVIWHNLAEAIRLRWRVMIRAGAKKFSRVRERLIALLVFVVPTVCLVTWSAIAYSLLASDGDWVFAVGAWITAVGFGAFFVVREMYRVLVVYRELTTRPADG